MLTAAPLALTVQPPSDDIGHFGVLCFLKKPALLSADGFDSATGSSTFPAFVHRQPHLLTEVASKGLQA